MKLSSTVLTFEEKTYVIEGLLLRHSMKTITATQARKELFQLMESVEVNHKPVAITHKGAVAIMISKSDWNATQEILIS